MKQPEERKNKKKVILKRLLIAIGCVAIIGWIVFPMYNEAVLDYVFSRPE